MGQFTDRATQALRFDELEGRFDAWLLCIALALTGLGVVMVASSSMPYAMSNGVGPFYYLVRHVIFLALGLAMASVLMRTEMKRIEQQSQFLLLMCFVLLLAVFVPGIGKTVNGGPKRIAKGTKITKEYLDGVSRYDWFDIRLSGEESARQLEAMKDSLAQLRVKFDAMFEQKKKKLTQGDELPPGVQKMVKVYVAVKRRLQPGD